MVVEVEGLRMRYGSRDVLDDVSFGMERGRVVALLGPNGAGKTTTIEILEGFRRRSAGRVAVLGVDPAHGTEQWRARVGIVLQSWRDHGRWRVREILAHLGSYYAPYSTPDTARPWDVDDLMAAVGLTDQADQEVRRLSGGQRRRLDVAVGAVGRPEVLFLDEPTAGFDPEARREFHDLVRRLVRDHGTTVLLTTHDLAEAETLADRILVLDGGRIVADGTAADLAHRLARDDEVRWSVGGERFVRSTPHSTAFARDLFAVHGEDLADLEIRRASLEDAYLALVRQAESGQRVAS
ncbi:multidrug ABC transporter ATP-binding protein [Cellulomonas sp. Root485]|uniref:ABC transporter ATP-binding protein n=1 Tax=Cellulomonas sp. Root485 TaxID=1736546 RepID=UPI0006FEBF75|nr:ABC transporter ATP-binding protein [Cellulomonas sp. Root485]KQY24245.1 multidrug ABC transporter ATP-binding protein [Cellulomonas sp. Root485]